MSETSSNNNKLEIGLTSLPAGHSILQNNDSAFEKSQEDHSMKTFKVPKSSIFSRLDTFLPQLKSANIFLEKEFAAGNKDKYQIEKEGALSLELDSDYDENMDDDEMESEQDSDLSSPKIEMSFAVAPFDVIDQLEDFHGDIDEIPKDDILSTLMKSKPKVEDMDIEKDEE
ncbi:hypothetical protein WA158_002016 [Blastocystis sp. Blastoise]